MFRHFISDTSKIVFSTSKQRLVFPLHTGVFRIDDNRNQFLFHYDKINMNKYQKFSEKVLDRGGINCSYTTQLYKLQDDTVSVSIPGVYYKIISTYNSKVLQVKWEDNSDCVSSIRVIPTNQLHQYYTSQDNDVFFF
jgi:hypothetical protein